MNNRLRPLFLLPFFFWSVTLYSQTIEIHQIDVGAGDATLIRIHNTVRDINILIDAGPMAAFEKVLNYLSSPTGGNLGAKPYLDYVISSHYHEDHIGGFVGRKKRDLNGCSLFPGVIGEPNCPTTYYAVLDKGITLPIPASQVYKDYVGLAGGSTQRRIAVGALAVGQFGAIASITSPAPAVNPALPGAGQQLALGGYIDLGVDVNNVAIRLRLWVCDSKVYAPDKPPAYIINIADSGQINRNKPGSYANPNNWGLGWVLEYGKFRYFTGGDIGGYSTNSYLDIETPLVKELPLYYTSPLTAPGHICTFKADHHGSEHSTSTEFLEGLLPTVGIFSCGGRHDHPRQEVIDRVAAANWDRADLKYKKVRNYYMTELHYNRDIDTAYGITSGNVMGVVTNVPVNPILTHLSVQMANLAYIYYINTALTQEVNGDIKMTIYPDDGNGHLISDLSVFNVQWKNYIGGAWVPGWRYTCHD